MNDIIGYLNRDYGYKGFKPIPKGTSVYKLDNERCYFEIETLNGEIHKQIFKTETIKTHLNHEPTFRKTQLRVEQRQD